MNFGYAELEHILSRGLAKARTLQSCHLVGVTGFEEHELQTLLKLLKIQKERHTYPASLNLVELNNLFAKMKKETNFSQFFADGLRKQLLKRKMVYKAAVKAPLFPVTQGDHLVLERILGHPEMLGSHKWIKSNESACKICNKLCYCVFVWNYRVQTDENLRYKFFK